MRELGIKKVEEIGSVPKGLETFLKEKEIEPKPGGGEQPKPGQPAPPPAGPAGLPPGVTLTPTGPRPVSLAAYSPRRVHQLLRHHVSQAARWLGEQIKRILKMRLRRAAAETVPLEEGS